MARARHEAAWTDADATVRGRVGGNRGWIMLAVGFALVATLSTFAYVRLMNFQDVTFELRRCQAPLSSDSTWQQVEAAGCEPVAIGSEELSRWEEGHQSFPDSTVGSSWTFSSVPVNTVVNAVELRLDQPARSVVVAEPSRKDLRVALTTDAAGRTWSGHIGDRAATTMWVLLTP